MSELINMQRKGFRKQLLATVSALALLGFACDAKAADNDSDHPPLWIELGGQLEQTSGRPDTFLPPFFSLASPVNLAPMVDAQRPSPFSIGGEGKIILMPEDTNWVLSAAIRYGRSNTAKHLRHQTAGDNVGKLYDGTEVINSDFIAPTRAFGDGQTTLRASHFVLDFQAGKDVGLGLFGTGGSSVVSAGVRFAQFTSSSDVLLHARPLLIDKPATSPGQYRLFVQSHATYTAVFHDQRSTHAIGPSVSWAASQPFVGNGSGMTLNFDWGVNAALLFGRQHASLHHQTTGHYLHKYGKPFTAAPQTGHYAHGPYDHDRSRTVTIPNAGGFAGLSLKFPNAKINLGYRADFFFGAMDGGIDTSKSENRGFFGPFAAISIGLGG
jgi:hypothetical protein